MNLVHVLYIYWIMRACRSVLLAYSKALAEANVPSSCYIYISDHESMLRIIQQ